MKKNANGNPMQMRQGDVFIEYTDEPIPADAKKVERVGGRLILAYGEVTGHAHAIADEGLEMYEDSAGTLWLTAPAKEAKVSHEEHSAHTLAPGRRAKSIVQQSWAAGFMRPVVD